MKNQTRRKFIVSLSKTVATIVGVGAFGKYISYSQIPEDTTIQTTKTMHGNKGKNENKILVTYESQFGSTAEVAHFIGKILSKDGSKVDIEKINEVDDLSSYSKVVVGSAIQYDKWMPEAREFVITNKEILAKLPVAFFFTCLVLSKKAEKAIQKANGYADKLYDLAAPVKPLTIGRFAGVLDYSKMSFAFRLVAKALLTIMGVKEGDYRNWDAIRLWANNIDFKSPN